MEDRKNHKKRVVKYLGNVGMALVSFTFMTPRAIGVDPVEAANQTVASEGGKEALNAALKIAGSKPALSIAAGITCIACLPVAGAAASPGLCIACGILIAKTVG